MQPSNLPPGVTDAMIEDNAVGPEPLDRLTDEITYQVVDLETTGLDGPRGEGADEVVEVASAWIRGEDALYADPRAGLAFQAAEALVNPGMPIPPQASAIHHITDADVEGMYSFEEAWDYHEDVSENHSAIKVAHNARFDAWFLGEDPSGWVCTYRLSSHLWPDAPGHGNQVLRYWLGLSVPGAQGMAAHRAMADVHVTAAILAACLRHERAQGMTGREILDLCNAPITQRTCRFGKHAGTPWADVPRDYLRWMERQGADAWDPDLWHTIQTHLRG